MNQALIGPTLPGTLSDCGLVLTSAVYEEIRAQERTKSAGSGAAPGSKLQPDAPDPR